MHIASCALTNGIINGIMAMLPEGYGPCIMSLRECSASVQAIRAW